MIAIIDYGMGNLRSVSKAFEAVGHQAVVTREARVIANASHVVLPGVGAFGDCMANLERYELIAPIYSAVQTGKPFLGICLGLQLLFTESEEFGTHKGLGIIPGRVKKFVLDPSLKVPHMGWNDVRPRSSDSLFTGIEAPRYYFLHSYYFVPEREEDVLATASYGGDFTAAIRKDHLFACQFHPEKSQAVGLRILRKRTKRKNRYQQKSRSQVSQYRHASRSEIVSAITMTSSSRQSNDPTCTRIANCPSTLVCVR